MAQASNCLPRICAVQQVQPTSGLLASSWLSHTGAVSYHMGRQLKQGWVRTCRHQVKVDHLEHTLQQDCAP